MSATKNTDAVSNQGGQFSSRVAPSEPLKEPVHKPGLLVTEKDRAPEFHAQAVPPGTAPADRTFQPNPEMEAPPTADDTEDNDPDSTRVSASDTLGGSTSADVYSGLGKPVQGQTHREIEHDGQHKRKKQHLGPEGSGASGVKQSQKDKLVDPRDPLFANQRALNKEDAVTGKGKFLHPMAEDRIPASAEEVAAEAPRK